MPGYGSHLLCYRAPLVEDFYARSATAQIVFTAIVDANFLKWPQLRRLFDNRGLERISAASTGRHSSPGQNTCGSGYGRRDKQRD